jgi:hypothetical protein
MATAVAADRKAAPSDGVVGLANEGEKVMAGKRNHPEDAIQRGIVQFLKFSAAPGVYFSAIPNGGFRAHLEAAIMNGLGVKKGIADLMIIAPGGRAHFLEVKAPTGRMRPEQLQFETWCRTYDVPHAVVRSIDEAVAALRGWGLVRVHSALDQARAA